MPSCGVTVTKMVSPDRKWLGGKVAAVLTTTPFTDQA
jgi:hypothetical protein